MAIRPANSVSILQKRLTQAEATHSVDAMELIGIHDELARIERKWIMQVNEGSDRRRPETDRMKLAEWYRRLSMLIERWSRSPAAAHVPAEAAAVRAVTEKIAARPSFPSFGK